MKKILRQKQKIDSGSLGQTGTLTQTFMDSKKFKKEGITSIAIGSGIEGRDFKERQGILFEQGRRGSPEQLQQTLVQQGRHRGSVQSRREKLIAQGGKMKKLRIIIGIFMLTILVMNVQGQNQPLITNGPTLTPFSETVCDEQDRCTSTLYSYQKYIDKGSGLELLNETFQDCGDTYCNDQLYHAELDKNLLSSVVQQGNEQLSLVHTQLGSTSLTGSMTSVIDGNKLTYEDIVPYVDVEYYYTWNQLKEVFVIKDPAFFTPLTTIVSLPFTFAVSTNQQASTVQGHVLLSRNGVSHFLLSPVVVYDADHQLLDRVDLSLHGNTLEFVLNLTRLRAASVTYPLYVDPTVTFNYANVSWNGHVIKDFNVEPETYTRLNAPAQGLAIGYANNDIDWFIYRSGIEWDTSMISDNATIEDINFTFYENIIGNSGNEALDFTHLENNHSTYDYEGGEEPFWNDMGNGTEFALINLNEDSNPYYVNLTSASSDFESKLLVDWWSFGLYSDLGETNARGTEQTLIASAQDVNITKRPSLTIVYSSNETGALAAIEAGIQDALVSDYNVFDDQQMYTRHQDNTQELSRFDRVAQKNNQFWAVNYVTAGESFTNMNNLTDRFYVIEMQGLSEEEIKRQVSSVIGNTTV